MRFLPAIFIAFAIVLEAFAADSTVVFNEIQYNPAPGQQEFIELRNLNGVDVHIGGWKIDGGVDFTFPAGTVVPGGGYVVVGGVAGSLGNFAGQLDNGGETLRLRNLNGRIMDEVTYDDANGWPTGADGSGASLSRRTASAASGPAAWTTSTTLGGTPGAQNFYEGANSVRTVPVPIGATWKYEDSGAVPPADWKTAAFSDAAWKSGAALIAGGGAKLGGGAKPSAYPTGLIAYWTFDETSGTVAANAVAGQPAGTMVNGAAFVADATRGQVAVFDGTNDRMEVIDSGTGLPSLTFLPSMTAVNDFTWAAWVWTSTSSTLADQSASVILGNRTNPNGVDTSPREFIKIMPTAMQYHRNAATENLDYVDLGTSAWTHICAVKRGLNLDYYKNGVFQITRTLSGGLGNALPFYVGGDRSGTGANANEHFAGRVDDVALWTRALSAAEIAQIGTQYGITPTLPTPAEQTTNAVTGPEPRLFRKTFTFSGTPNAATLELWPVADDGVVVYLNGTEVYRNNVPPTVEAGDAKFPSATTVISNVALVNGTNVLSAEVHQFAGGNNDLLFGAELAITSVPGPSPASPPSLTFSEITGAGEASFYVELRNTSAGTVSTAGWSIVSSNGQSVALAAQNVAAGDYLVLNAAALGFTPANGAKLFLLATGGAEMRDAREVTGSLRGLLADGSWGHPTSATPGAANVATISTAIVINEIYYHAPGASAEQWIELHNRSGSDVDIAGWKLSEGVSFDFPVNTMIPAGGFLVVAWNPASFAALHPGVTALGPWSGSLSGSGETITLEDANGNTVNQVTYSDGGRWSQWADGGGSSLELIDPRADNSRGEAWDGSDESTHSTWQNVSISGTAALNPANNPTTWNEFLFGLLNAGEMLIDDISVKDLTQGNVELIQNGTFSGGTANFWRIIGTQSGSVVDDPLSPGNKVLKVIATAETEHMHNHAGTTLKNGASFHTIVATDTYNITFRAKWLRGSNLLHSRLYVNRLPLKTALNRPATGGTPGAQNSRFVANLGPTFDALAHSPVVPAVSQAATVSVKVADPDGIASVQLFTSINGAAFTSAAMTAGGGGVYTGTVTGQAAGAVVQFYLRATDTPGAFRFFPAAGAASRAMIQWEDGRAQLTLASGARPHNLRVIMPGADANNLYRSENLMSNAAIPCTVIFDEKDVYYRAGVSLKSSEHGRFNIARVGYNVEFPADDLFLGVHGGISIDRSGGTTTGQKEILLKTLSILAGGVHAPQDDIIRLLPATATGTGFAFDGSGMIGAAILSKTRLKGDYLGSQWDNGGDGMMFKYERVYVLTQTINAATRAVDASIVPENPKIPQDSTSPPGVAVTNLGANPEFYRWHWLVEGGRDTDDYTGIMNVTNAVGQAGGTANFNNLANQYIDVNEWLRAHVPAVLYGVTDNYMAPTGSGQHNTLVYFPPGQKAVIFPWDMDFLAQSNPTTTSLTGGGDIAKFIANPVWKRLYYGHMLDILNRSFNTATMTTWATHYQRFGTDEMLSSVSAYLTPRAQYARDVITGTNGQSAPVPFVAFARTSASPVTVSTPFATVTGTGWINLAEIRLLGSAEPLAITWTTDTAWTLQLPIAAGTNTYTLVPYDGNGVQLTNAVTGGTPASATVTITGTGGIFPAGPGNLVVSELNYNPVGGTEATEFIELLNVTGATLDLGGCHFDEELGQGIAYTFPAGVQVAAGARIVVPRIRTSFIAAYPSGTNLAPNQYDPSGLDNGGESIVLYSAGGLEIFRFSYNDTIASTDGGGRSLVRVLSSTNPNASTYVWRASTQNGGNPGSGDAIAFTGSPLADLDGDGVPALIEYVCGTSDNNPASRPAPAQFVFDLGGNVTVTFPLLPNADDAICTVETTTTLGTGWVPLNGPIAAGPNRFFRLSVTLR